MSKKYQDDPDPPENSERWMITYSDLITLLLVFFIIMYTMAKMDNQKFEAVKESLAGALKSGQQNIRVGKTGILKDMPIPKTSASDAAKEAAKQEQKKLEQMEIQINNLVQKYNLQGYITVTQEERGLDIEIRNELNKIILFNSGSADLNPPAEEIILKIGYLLNELPDNFIRIEGHTDNKPIHNKLFDTNWDLANARASTVTKVLINSCGVSPKRLSTVGYGEFKPVASNDTEEGRAQNRRVSIVIIKQQYNVVESH